MEQSHNHLGTHTHSISAEHAFPALPNDYESKQNFRNTQQSPSHTISPHSPIHHPPTPTHANNNGNQQEEMMSFHVPPPSTHVWINGSLSPIVGTFEQQNGYKGFVYEDQSFLNRR